MSDAPAKKAGFPIGLTVATAHRSPSSAASAAGRSSACTGRKDLLARIEMLKTAPAVPLARC
jgi:surfeit locus 1 family protein